MFSVEEILKITGGRRDLRGKTFKGISIDSRTVKKDDLFIAIKGKRFDGHDFINHAFKKGASGAVVSCNIKTNAKDTLIIKVKDTLKTLGDIALYHRKRFHIPVIGITGSSGKTTVKDMVSHILGKKFPFLKNRGNENNLIGLPMALLGMNKRHKAAVLEMGANHFGEIKRLSHILKPSIGLITNIGFSHLEYLKDKEGVLRAKKEIASSLAKKDVLILNSNDPMLLCIKPKCRVLKFGLKKDNDFYATGIKIWEGISFALNGRYPLFANLLGKHNLYNMLAAIAVSLQFGIKIPDIREALYDFKLPRMRMEKICVKGINIINDAYNSNPLSLKWAIQTLSDIKAKGRKIAVVGDMLELGSKARFFHKGIGRFIARSSIEFIITVGELSDHTAFAASRAGMNKAKIRSCRNSGEARNILKEIARPGDVVLIKASRALALERIIEEF